MTDIVVRLRHFEKWKLYGGEPPDRSDFREAADEIERLRAGLKIIVEAGSIHGGGWCVAQARGYLEDLDFDQFPETGKA